jgi:hypothetical protein
MVRKHSVTDGGDSANAAAGVRVVLSGARSPCSGVILDVDLATGMVEPEIHAWHDGQRVPLVVDVRHMAGKKIVHKVREVLIANPGQAVPVSFDLDLGV